MASYTSGEGMRIASQRRFVADASGRWLAYAHAASHGYRLRDARGNERVLAAKPGADLRFASAGRVVAVEGWARIAVATPERPGDAVILGELPTAIEWIEPCELGVVALWYHDGEAHLSLVSWDGRRRDLPTSGARIERLTAGRRATRVAWAETGAVFDVDLSERDPRPRRLTTLPDVHNGEMSDNGALIAFASSGGLSLIEGHRRRNLSRDGDFDVVWFDRQRLLAASPRRAMVFEGKERRALDANDGAPIGHARFRRGGEGVIVARGRDVLLWEPRQARSHVLATVPDGRLLLGAELVGNDLVVWSGRVTHRRLF